MNLQVMLYDRDLASPTLVEDLTNRQSGMRFSTKLHGGFSQCSFSLHADMAEAWEWATRRGFYRLVVRDGEKILWEGRLQNPIIRHLNNLDITALGYYASLNDQPYKTAYNANADVVIKAMLTAGAPQISADQSHISATGGPAITSAAGDDYLDKPIRQLIEKLADFGDTAGNQWYFAVWENRLPWFFTRSLSSVNWRINLSDLNDFSLPLDYTELWNKTYAVYESGGIIARTTDAQDATSQSKFGITRYYAIPNLGAVASAAADAKRDAWLSEHKQVYPAIESLTLGDTVLDNNRRKYSSAWVRAGQVIRVNDLIPVTAELDSITRDNWQTYYIVETEYSVDHRTNRLTLTSKKKALDALLARKLSGI